MKKQLGLYILLLFFLAPSANSAHGQWINNLDSLQKKIASLEDDTVKVNLLCDLSYQYFGVNPSVGLAHGLDAEALARRLNYKRGLAAAYYSIGSNFWAKNNLYKAQTYFWKAYYINDSIGNLAGIAKGRHSLAVIYESQNQYAEALASYKKALEMYVQLHDKEGILGCYSNIADVYEKQELYEKALTYEDSTMIIRRWIREEPKHTKYVAFTENRIGTLYAKKSNLPTSLKYHRAALAKYLMIKDTENIAGVWKTMAETFSFHKLYDSALYYYQKAFDAYGLLKTHSSLGLQGRMLREIGDVYKMSAVAAKYRNAERNLKKARESYLLGLPFSDAVSDKENLMSLYQRLYRIDSASNRFESSLFNYKKFASYRDSVLRDADGKSMAAQEQIYQAEKYRDSQALAQTKNFQTQQLKNQRVLFGLLGLLIIVVASTLLFFYKRRLVELRIKNELQSEKAVKQLKEAELSAEIQSVKLAAIRSQMNPHFIFNTLNTIQSFIYSEDKRIATDYLAKFSELIRKTLTNSAKQIISLQEEIEMLNLYLEIEQKRYGEQFRYQIYVDQKIDQEEIGIPPMLLQPYVENAIKHGLLHKEGAKNLTIDFNLEREFEALSILIEDNGVGRSKSGAYNQLRTKHQSFANEANERRISLIQQLYEKTANVKIEDVMSDLGTPSGTRVLIRIPIMLTEN